MLLPPPAWRGLRPLLTLVSRLFANLSVPSRQKNSPQGSNQQCLKSFGRTTARTQLVRDPTSTLEMSRLASVHRFVAGALAFDHKAVRMGTSTISTARTGLSFVTAG